MMQDYFTRDTYESNVWIDGHLLQDEGIAVLLSSDEPALPPARNMTVDIPGMHGSYDFGAYMGPREIKLSMAFPRQSYTDLKRQIQSLNKRLLDDYGRPRTVKVVFGDESDKFLYARVASGIMVERISERGMIDVPMVAYDPHKYSNIFADEVLWGSTIITFEYDYLLGREGIGGSVCITNPQTLIIPVDGLAVQPIFEINGTANNLTISANGYSFTLPNFTDTTWTIDFEKYLVYRNGQETMEEIREFYLMPGDNDVKISGSNINLDMRIKYRDKFM